MQIIRLSFNLQFIIKHKSEAETKTQSIPVNQAGYTISYLQELIETTQSIQVNHTGYTIYYLQELTENITIHPCQSGWINNLLPAGTHRKHHRPSLSIRLDKQSPTCRNSQKTSQFNLETTGLIRSLRTMLMNYSESLTEQLNV